MSLGSMHSFSVQSPSCLHSEPEPAQPADHSCRKPPLDAHLRRLVAEYGEVVRYNIEHPEEAKVFVLGEMHDNLECARHQAALMNYLAPQGNLVAFHEGSPQGQVVQAPFLHVFTQGLLTENFCIVGCDHQSSQEVIQDIQGAQKRASHAYDQARLSRAYQNLNLNVIAQDLEEIRQKQSCQHGKLGEGALLVYRLQARLQHLKAETDVLKSEMNIRKYAFISNAFIAHTFQARTRAIVETLETVRNGTLQKSLFPESYSDENVKIVVLLGAFHVKVPMEDKNNDCFKLDMFYEKLNQCKVMTLLPKNVLETCYTERAALLRCIIEERSEQAKEYLRDGELSLETLELALWHAASRDEEIFRLILNRPGFRPGNMDLVFEKAVRAGKMDTIRALLAHDAFSGISQQGYDKALIAAAEEDLPEIVTVLLRLANYSQVVFELACEKAADACHQDILQRLLQSCSARFLSDEIKARIISAFLTQGEFGLAHQIIDTLSDDNNPSLFRAVVLTLQGDVAGAEVEVSKLPDGPRRLTDLLDFLRNEDSVDRAYNL